MRRRRLKLKQIVLILVCVIFCNVCIQLLFGWSPSVIKTHWTQTKKQFRPTHLVHKEDCFGMATNGGPITINTTYGSLENFASDHGVQEGGMYSPKSCRPKQKTALIVPYRNREVHLNLFLRHMHPFLQKQQIEYGIFVVDMVPSLVFVKALVMNIAFLEVLRTHDFQCFIFHDIDLLPEDDRIPYTCSDNPAHLSVAIDKFNYTLPYSTLYGGVLAMKKGHFQAINGYSNMFFGWGGEDDDLSVRINRSGLVVKRPPQAIARYQMLKHNQSKPNPDRSTKNMPIIIAQYLEPLTRPPTEKIDFRTAMKDMIEAKVSADDMNLIQFIQEKYISRGKGANINNRERIGTKLALAVDEALGRMRNGVFIEFGTDTGRKYSHSTFFEKRRNWTGIIIEADPLKFRKLEKQQRKTPIINACVTNKSYPTQGTYDGTSVIEDFVGKPPSIENDDNINEYTSDELEKTETNPYLFITCFPIQSILLAVSIKTANYLSVNNDRNQFHILSSFPLEQYNIQVVSVSHSRWRSGPIALDYFMRQRNFTFYKTIDQTHSNAVVYIKQDIYRSKL